MALSEREISQGVHSSPRQDFAFPRPRILPSEASAEVERDFGYIFGFLRKGEKPPRKAGTVGNIPVYEGEGKSFTFKDPNDDTKTPLYVQHLESSSDPLSASQPHIDTVIGDINRPEEEPTVQPKRELIKTLVTVLVSALPKP